MPLNLILASNSPRRKELLKGLGLHYEVRVKQVEEDYPETLQREEIARYLASHKAEQYRAGLAENELLLTADTIVWLDGQVLNKPKDYDDAFRMLRLLSGNMHEVLTGVCLLSTTTQRVFHDETKVYFKELTDAEIDFYITHYKPFDKAGAYGAQDWIGMVAVERLEGSYFNVMGLPVHRVYEELLKFNMNLNAKNDPIN